MIRRAISKRAFAIAVAAMLLAALVPSAAFAADFALASASGASGQLASGQLETQAAKTTVYVLEKAGDESLSYNENGLVTKKSGKWETRTYRYSGKQVKSISVSTSSSGSSTIKPTYDKKGRVKKVVSSGTSNYTETYKYDAKGRVKSTKRTSAADGTATTSKYSYDSKGRLVKTKTSANQLMKYGYDSRGNLNDFTAGPAKGGGFTRYIINKYSYKNGRAAKCSQTTNGMSGRFFTTKYTYKKMSIPKGYVTQVKKQQRALLGNPNPALIL